MSMILPSAASDLALLEAAAREGGVIARELFGTKVETWSKGAAGPVTAADLAINALLHEKLGAARPDYGWLSEETADDDARLAKPRCFVVDPIDGTRAFIEHVPEFTIALAIIDGDRPWLGCIYNPMTDEMFLGGENIPATLNGAPIGVSGKRTLENASIIGNKGFFSAKKWPEPWPPMRFTWRHSVAYRMALVAAGKFDFIALPGRRFEWDVAAGVAIARAAGAVVTGLKGEALRFNQPDPIPGGIVVAGPHLHPLLLDRFVSMPQDLAT